MISDSVFEDDAFVYDTLIANDDDRYYSSLYDTLSQNRYVDSIFVKKNYYANGNIKSKGLSAIFLKRNFADNFQYKIGVWKFFDKAGKLEKTIGYNLKSQKQFVEKY